MVKAINKVAVSTSPLIHYAGSIMKPLERDKQCCAQMHGYGCMDVWMPESKGGRKEERKEG